MPGVRTATPLIAFVVVAGSLTACNPAALWPGGCRAVSLSIAASAVGAPTTDEAIKRFVSGDTLPGLPTSGWSGPSAGGDFHSGSATAVVQKLPGNQGFFVTEARTC